MPCSNSIIQLLTLAPQGSKKIDWVQQHMAVLNKLRDQYIQSKPFKGLNIVLRLHIEATTGYLAILLRDAGANVTLVQACPMSTQDDVVAALYEEDIRVLGKYNLSQQQHQLLQKDALASKPHVVIDTGGILTHLLHTECSELATNFIGCSEESATGVKRLQQMDQKGDLKFPVVAVNNSLSKFLFENLHGTGQSVWSSIMNTTNLVISGKMVVVIGYGWCGKGIARKAKALGARVIVCEIDSLKSSEALMDGFHVLPLAEAISLGDFIITATGVSNIISQEQLDLIKDRAILANGGHSFVEINKFDLTSYATEVKQFTDKITQYVFKNGKSVFLLADGHIVNSAAGDGQPIEVMDISFALHIMAIKHLIAQDRKDNEAIVKLPRELDEYVSKIYLQQLGVSIDKLALAQQNYFNQFPY